MAIATRYNEIAELLAARRVALSEPLRLPGEDDLAQEHSVARDTVRRALHLLEKQGAVTRRRGRGTFLQPVRTTLKNLHGQTVAFVPPVWADSVSDGYTARVFAGVARWADEQHCHLTILHAEQQSSDTDAWPRRLTESNVAGIVWVHPRRRQLALVQRLARRWPTVVLGRYFADSGLHHVVPDYGQAARFLDRHLVAHGHRQYTLVNVDNLEAYGRNWVEAVEAAHRERGDYFDSHAHLLDVMGLDRRKLASLLLDFHQPTHPEICGYVLTTSSLLPGLIADERFRSGLENGRLSVATMDYGLYPMEAYWPGHTVTHVTCDWAQLGRRSLETLALLTGGHDAPALIQEPVAFETGQTVHEWSAASAGQ